MRATVRSDTTERTITLEVSCVPDLDVTESWHRRPRVIRPDYVTMTLVDGRFVDFSAHGWLVRKDGTPGGNRDTWKCHKAGTRFQKNTLDRAPEWVQRLVREAPSGVTSWSDQ